MQIEARVDQQTEISRELSLWDQRGSRVIRGNLLVIPVSDSFIYVEPVYLEAKQEEKEAPAAAPGQSKPFGKSQRGQTKGSTAVDKSRSASLPELKRVIVAHGNVAREATPVYPGEGEMVIFKPDGKGQFTFVGRITPDRWVELSQTN